MERLQRAIELARIQRDDGLAGAVTAVESAALLAGRAPEGGAPSGDDAAAAKPRVLQPRHVVPIDRDGLRERRVVFPEDRGPAAHAYRMLRAQLLQRAATHRIRTIGFVSPVSGEGKSLTCLNVALSLAAAPNHLVVLADLDLRNPSLATLLDLPSAPGIETYLNGSADLDDIARGLQGVERLVVVPACSSIAASSESLAGARGRMLMDGLRSGCGDGLLLLDLPPVLLCDDVLTLAPALDGVVVVVTEGRTMREDFNRLQELLSSVRILGTVLNGSAESERRAY